MPTASCASVSTIPQDDENGLSRPECQMAGGKGRGLALLDWEKKGHGHRIPWPERQAFRDYFMLESLPSGRNGVVFLLRERVSFVSRFGAEHTARSPDEHEIDDETRELNLGPPSVTYDAPPLVEVAMSIQFDPPKGLNQAHLGAFWVTQKDTLPHVRAVQPIVTTNEVFGGQGQWLPPSLQLELTNEPDCRLQMTSSDDQWMCQVQRNRLVINWRKRNGEYPRFSATWHRFRKACQAWETFLGGLEMAPLKLRLWELTYVNRIPKENLWDKPGDWPKVFPGLWGGNFAAVEGAELGGFQGQWVWESAEPPARLYVEPRPGRSVEEPHEDVLLLSLTARGLFSADFKSNKDPNTDPIESGMSSGHDLIVGTFDRIASDVAKKAWGRHADLD